MLAVVFSTAIFAQLHKADVGQKINFSQRQNIFSTQLAPSAIEMYASGQKSAPKYSPASGLYFYKPSGSMYVTFDLDAVGYYEAFLSLPALRVCTFLNGSNNPTSTRWYLDDVDYTDTYADSNGNLRVSFYPVPIGNLDNIKNNSPEGYYAYPCPVLWNSAHTDSYALPTYYADDYPAHAMPFAELEWLAFTEDLNTGWWGALDNDNMCGSGTYTEYGEVYKSVAVYQDYPKPTAPLYVEEMYVEGVSITGTPLKNGATLDLNIYDAETDELLGTFTATAYDWIDWGTGSRNGINVETGCLVFRHIVEGLFGEENEPITIDRATHVELVGFDNDDVDFGPALAEVNESDTYDFPRDVRESMGRAIIEDADGVLYNFGYTDQSNGLPLILNIGFYSMMDYVMVVDGLTWYDDGSDETGYSILQIGTTPDDCHTYGKEGTSHDLGALYVVTVCPWVDEDTQAENYYSDEMPDWISGIYYNDYYYDTDNLTYVKFTAEELPAGVTGRVASFRLQGRGYTDDTYVVVVQGDGDPTGIESIPAAAAASSSAKGTYNIAGQRVVESAKGILVRDGKKFIAK